MRSQIVLEVWSFKQICFDDIIKAKLAHSHKNSPWSRPLGPIEKLENTLWTGNLDQTINCMFVTENLKKAIRKQWSVLRFIN